MTTGTMSDIAADTWLRRFLNVYWLRPESAMIFAHDAQMYSKYRAPSERSMDIGCGDGITSFLLNGGVFAPHFDAYYSVNSRASYRYDTNENAFVPDAPSDFYDAYDAKSFTALGEFIEQPPDMRFGCGTDWKQNLLNKASYLKLYDRLVCHDSSQPFHFIKDESLAYVFSNTFYWIMPPEAMIREVYRMLEPGGVVVATFPNDNLYRQAAIDRLRVQYHLPWISQLDRGRGEHWQTIGKPRAFWQGLFERTGFKTVAYEAYFPGRVFEVSEYGLRPLFPSLSRMRELLLQGDRRAFLEFKRYWIDNCTHFLLPLLSDPFFDRFEKVYHVFRFEKP